MAQINNILSGSAGVKKRYQVNETMADIGAVVLVSPSAGAGLALASTAGAADVVGLNLTTATYGTVQGSGTSSAESLTDIIINPDAVMRFKLSGGTTEGTAVETQTVTVASSGGTAIETGAAWDGGNTVLNGVAWGFSGGNVGQFRKLTTVSSTVGTVLVPFDFAIAVDDVFLRAPFWTFDPNSGDALTLTAAFFEVNVASIASTAGGNFNVVDFDLRDASEDGRSNSFVEALAGDHFLSRLS